MAKIIISEARKIKIEEEVLAEVLREITEIEVEKGEIPRPPYLYLAEHQKFFKKVFAVFFGLTAGLLGLRAGILISELLTARGFFIY